MVLLKDITRNWLRVLIPKIPILYWNIALRACSASPWVHMKCWLLLYFWSLTILFCITITWLLSVFLCRHIYKLYITLFLIQELNIFNIISLCYNSIIIPLCLCVCPPQFLCELMFFFLNLVWTSYNYRSRHSASLLFSFLISIVPVW